MTNTVEQDQWAEREPLAKKLMSLIELGPEARVYAHPTYCVDSNIDKEWIWLYDGTEDKRPKRYDAVLFVDDNPRANWSHQCRYVFLCGDEVVSVRGQLPPLTDFNYWRIMPQKWDPESDYTKQAESLIRQQRLPRALGAYWWRVVPVRQALEHVGSRGCLVEGCGPVNALHKALSSGMIQDWQEPVVQEIEHPLIGQVIPL